MENVLASPHAPPLTVPSSRAQRIAGRVLTGLVVAFLLLDALGKLLLLAPVVEGTQKVGFALGVIRPLGLVLAVSTLLHLIPQTQLLGALLLTAYLGGAAATNLHAGTPLWFPVALGAILWTAYALRSPALRALAISPAR
jgi:hypothetical protein